VKSDFEKRAQAVAERLAEELDSQLHISAESKGWTAPIHLEAKKGNLNLVYDTNDKVNLFNSEYGNQNQSPNSVVRPFLNDSETLIAAEIESEAVDYLFEVGVLP
jgi:hypothetical protein